MKPREQKPAIVFRIISRQTGAPCGSYSRACCDEYDFSSVSEARSANVHGLFEDTEQYAIAKYRVTYELIEPDCLESPDEIARRAAWRRESYL